MSIVKFKNDLTKLETDVANHFSELIKNHKEFIIFDEVDLEDDTPDDYLEMRNDITGDVFDVHPLKVNNSGILVVEAEETSKMHLIRFSDLSSINDRINLIELMENSL
jgi:hypothetical protein